MLTNELIVHPITPAWRRSRADS